MGKFFPIFCVMTLKSCWETDCRRCCGREACATCVHYKTEKQSFVAQITIVTSYENRFSYLVEEPWNMKASRETKNVATIFLHKWFYFHFVTRCTQFKVGFFLWNERLVVVETSRWQLSSRAGLGLTTRTSFGKTQILV